MQLKAEFALGAFSERSQLSSMINHQQRGIESAKPPHTKWAQEWPSLARYHSANRKTTSTRAYKALLQPQRQASLVVHSPCKPIAHVIIKRLVISWRCSDDKYNVVQGPSKSLLPLLPATQHTFPKYLEFLTPMQDSDVDTKSHGQLLKVWQLEHLRKRSSCN